MAVRDHQGIPLTAFNGLWQRGNPDTVPVDHFSDCNNIDYFGRSSFQTRPGIAISQTVKVPLSNVKRVYNYPTQSANTLIVLTIDPVTGNGNIYHVVNTSIVYGPILTINGMTDFAFVPYAGRGYISPFTDYINGALTFQSGMASQFLYVYAGDGTPARKAAGAGLAGNLTIADGVGGFTTPGFRVFGIVSQTVSGYQSPPAALTSFTTDGTSVSIGNIPTSGDPYVTTRFLVSTLAIPSGSYTGDLSAQEFFFVPNAVINDNTTTFINNVSFYDASLLDDASALLNNLTQVPAGAVMCLYHNRLIVAATNTDISLAYVSLPGQPEAFDQIAGLIVVPLDGNPISNAQEMRDVLYLFKRSRTVSYADNNGNPSSWPLVVIDPALGTSPHGIATVLDSGGVNVDAMIIATYQGISRFNGVYITPELTWKIQSFWQGLDFTDSFGKIQMVHSPVQKKLYVVLPSRNLLVGNYANGLDYKNIRWAPWSVRQSISTVAIQNITDIILGADIF
jgi:hypothetical protein